MIYRWKDAPLSIRNMADKSKDKEQLQSRRNNAHQRERNPNSMPFPARDAMRSRRDFPFQEATGALLPQDRDCR